MVWKIHIYMLMVQCVNTVILHITIVEEIWGNFVEIMC